MEMGFGIGPNGQFGPVLMVSDSSTESKTLESHLQTPEGIQITVRYEGAQQELADRYERDIVEKLGWTAVRPAPDQPWSLTKEILVSWFTAIMLAIVVPAILGVIQMIYQTLTGHIGDANFGLDNYLPIGFWTLGVSGTIMTALVLLSHHQGATETPE